MNIIYFISVLFSLSVQGNDSALLPFVGERFFIRLQYLTPNNFLGKNVYEPFELNQCYVRRDLHRKLKALETSLKKKRKKLVLWDCYRPLKVQEAMWKLVPDPRYVADPKTGSNHNRGAAVDCALADESGKLLEFPTAFDDFTPKASPGYSCSQEEKEKCKNRDLLIRLMASVGLEVFPTEWWHYQLPQAEKLAVIPTIEPAK